MKRVEVISFTREGFRLSLRMKVALSDTEVVLFTTKEEIAAEHPEASRAEKLSVWCKDAFSRADAIVFIGASGIAVRTIAPYLVSKTADPAVLVADERGRHLISLLSGHLGGGNELTLRLAGAIGADPVITTASDVEGKLAVDVWAKKNDLIITDLKAAKRVAAAIVDGKQVPLLSDGPVDGNCPPELKLMNWTTAANLAARANGDFPPVIFVSPDLIPEELEENCDVLHLIPRCRIAGMGCKRGTKEEDLKRFLFETATVLGCEPASIGCLASIDVKADEEGLLALAKTCDIPFVTYSAETLQSMPGTYTASSFVNGKVGVDNVCERAAVAALPEEEREEDAFLARKHTRSGMTLALTQKKWRIRFE